MDFIVYSKEKCPYCYKIEQVLQLTGKKFVIYKLDRDFDRTEFIEKFGEGSTFPQVLYNDQKLGGCIDTIKFLKQERIGI